jgi:protein-S-isoprenylcysteine O-methyltransferase Ste14
MEEDIGTDGMRGSGNLLRLVLQRGASALAILALTLFLPAGTFQFWEAWVFLAVVTTSATLLVGYFIRRDPKLIERRMRMKEKEAGQRKIMKFSYVVFGLSCLIPGLDRRCGWSDVSVPLVLAADFLIIAGYLIFAAVLKVNSYASRVIEVESGQTVVSTGPYAVVRHPLYVASLLIFVFAPLALGSYWGLPFSAMTIPVIVARIRNEEQVLASGLRGYAEYMRSTRFRLIPGLW